MSLKLIALFPQETCLGYLEGPAGVIETLVEPCTENFRNITAIICHPHSLHGGTMNNKVVHILSRALLKLGANCVRFNFRGVGKSSGEFDHGHGEQADLRAIIKWVQQQRPQDKIWLAGFSFGSYVSAAVAATTPEISQLISIAPPVVNFPFADLPPITQPWLIVQPLEDEIVSAPAVLSWANTLPKHVVVKQFPETGHFFHGKLIELRELLIGELM